MKMNSIVKKILLFISLALLVIPAIVTAGEDTDVDVRVNAPEYVSGTFEVTIDIANVIDLDSGQFDLSFDSSVVNVEEMEAGSIDNTEVPIAMWRFMDDDTIRVTFNLPGADGVSGSGHLAKIFFKVVGNPGDISIMDLSDTSDTFERGLVDIYSDLITTNWFNDNVTVNTLTSASTSAATPMADTTPSPTPVATSVKTTPPDSTPGSITSYTPAAQDTLDTAVPTETSERDDPDGLDALTTHNFIAIYSLIGLLAFIYTLTILK
jgi:hypothetical protein